jgi:hypothetical protein
MTLAVAPIESAGPRRNQGRMSNECKRAALALPLHLFLAELSCMFADPHRSERSREAAKALHARITADGPAQPPVWA